VFSSDEIKTIIRKRREFEYRLQKRIVQKTDFLRYMQVDSRDLLCGAMIDTKKSCISFAVK